jgi:hypothetical protein
MNASQEAILDRLMVADTIGALWTPGPVDLAAQALRGAGLAPGGEAPHALGYPAALCAALGGASGLLGRVDDVRTLAISVFRAVAPREEPPDLPDKRLVAVALWSARRARSLHPGSANLANEAENLIERALAGRTPAGGVLDGLSTRLERAIRRVRLEEGQTFCAGRLALSALYFALHGLRQMVTPAEARKRIPKELQVDNNSLACRDGARLATLVKGLNGAVAFCLDLAAELGM